MSTVLDGEQVWRTQPAWADVPDLELTARDGGPVDHLLVVVAHPDDETLAVGGLIHDAGRRGLRTTVLVASDGEASHPHSPTHSPADLAAIRRAELAAAMRTLNRRACCRRLGLGDGLLSGRVDTLTREISARADAATLVVSTWRDDGHPDHEAVALAAAAAAARCGSRHLEAPIWAWAWTSPAELPWSLVSRHRCSTEALRRKETAMSAYRSQTQPLSDDPADAAVVPDTVLAHFRRPFEALIEHAAEPIDPRVDGADGDDSAGSAGGADDADGERPVPATVFDAMYADGDDPWRHEDSWYEERKRAIALASLPTRGLGRVLELGPATGLLTVELARRGRSVLSVDVSEQALARTRRRVADTGLGDRVELRCARVPESWPPGRFDTVVVSEMAYYLTPREWARTLRRIADALSPDGALLLVHWAHPLQGCPLDTDTAHEMAARESGLRTTVHHVEADFVLRVLRPPGLPSLAAAEGRC